MALVQIILAHLIDVEYFGVIATVTILLQILAVVVDGGLGAALVQREKIDRTDVSTVFYFNLLSSLALLLLVVALRGTIADYLNEPLLKEIIPWLASGAFLAAIGQAQIQMMTRNLKFRRLAIISFPAAVLGGSAGIVLAMLDFQVWALVYMRLGTILLTSILAWIFCPSEYQPDFRFSIAALKRLSGLSLGVLGSNLIMKITRNMIELIIQKVFGAKDLGFYSRARFFQKAPTEPLLSILNRVLFPVFSTIQNDNRKIKRSLRTGVPILMFCVSPLMFWMIVTAKPLVIVLLSEKWLETVQYLRWTPLIGITFALSAIKSNVIKSKGDGRTIFVLSLLRNGISLATLAVTWRFGILAMLISQIGCYIVNMTINEIATSRYIGYSMQEQRQDYLPSLGASLLAAGLVSPLLWVEFELSIVDLTLQTSLFWLTYLMIAYLTGLSGLKALQKIAGNVFKGNFRGAANFESNVETKAS